VRWRKNRIAAGVIALVEERHHALQLLERRRVVPVHSVSASDQLGDRGHARIEEQLVSDDNAVEPAAARPP
jgi:hypothetical protein